MVWFRKSPRKHEREAPAPAMVTKPPRPISGLIDLPLPDGHVVDYLDSRATPGGEIGAMDIIEARRRPAILRTSEGWYIPWIDGHTCGWAEAMDDAVEQLSGVLSTRESRD